MLPNQSSLHPILEKTERPKVIFGQSVSRFRKTEIQAILYFYNHSTNARYQTKVELLDMLGALERVLSDADRFRVVQFIRHGGLLGGASRADVMQNGMGDIKHDIKQDTKEDIKQDIKQDSEEEDQSLGAERWVDIDMMEMERELFVVEEPEPGLIRPNLYPGTDSMKAEDETSEARSLLIDIEASHLEPVAGLEEEAEANNDSKAGQYCTVCLEHLVSTSFPTQKVTAACEHESTVCLECLSNHLTSQIQEKAWNEIQCPLCPKKLEQLDVRSFAKEDDFNRYLDLSLNAVTHAEPDYILCMGPGCGKLQAHDGGEANNIVTCSYCQFKMCFAHQRPMHHGLTCAEFDEAQGILAKENEASVEMIKTTYRYCPGAGCGVPIELKSGCSHMTCNQCHHQFCYECLASWEKIIQVGNSEHALGCKFHTDNLEDGIPEEMDDEEEMMMDDEGMFMPEEIIDEDDYDIS